jgi:hypothetical protein
MVNIYSYELLNKLPTKRLLALKKKTYKQTGLSEDWTSYCSCEDCKYERAVDSEAWSQIDMIKDICKNREHIQRK